MSFFKDLKKLLNKHLAHKLTERETIDDLKLYDKPYLHIKMCQSVFSNILTRYKAGILKPKTLHKFLEQFGYFKEGDYFIKKFNVGLKKNPIKKRY